MSHGDSLGRGARVVNLREAVWHEPMATSRVGIFAWTSEQAGCKWVVTLHSPDEHDFSGKTLEEALARAATRWRERTMRDSRATWVGMLAGSEVPWHAAQGIDNPA
jgi:hypothetical protein